ncbi:hypothetical protein C5167_036026 [Papaver somniferum]|nr:hypothetical protein C5167_036026 [Papaver somniferum]
MLQLATADHITFAACLCARYMMNQLRMLCKFDFKCRYLDTKHDLKSQGEDARLMFPFQSFVSFNVAKKTSLNPRAERKNCGRSSRWEGYFSSNKPMKQISVLRMTLAKLWVHMVWSLKNERQEAENMFSSKQAEEEAKKESTQTFISGEVPDVIETSENDKVAKSVAPTPEQIIAIKV